jgi:hypothetical protein
MGGGWGRELDSSFRIGKVEGFVNTNKTSGFSKYGKNLDWFRSY